MKQAKEYHKTHVKNGKTYHVTSLTDAGKADKEMTIAMALIKSTKYNPAQADAFRRVCKIGEYREWTWDMIRLKEINNIAFSETAGICPNPRDPLLLHFRIKTNNVIKSFTQEEIYLEQSLI